MWILGDNFLKEAHSSLLDLRDKAAQRNLPVPFIFKQFNIRAFYTNKGFRTGINILLDPLAEALNKYHKLLKYMLVVPDKDLLSHLKWDNGISVEIGASLHYLVKQQDLYLQRRKRELAQKKPGALIADDYPKIIWIRMLKRPQNLVNGTVFTHRRKFNSILKERLLDGNAAVHHIMSIDIQQQDFDIGGNLTPGGKTTFWNEVNRAMQKFDADTITLRPRKYKPQINQNMPKVMNPQEHKLPSPPPRRGGHSHSRSTSCHKKSSYRSRSRSHHSKRRHRSSSRHHSGHHNHSSRCHSTNRH